MALIGAKKAFANISKSINNQTRRLMILIDSGLVRTTPVAEGTARANWLPSTNARRRDTVSASGRVKAELGLKQDLIGGNVFYLSNNLPYIEGLNDGSSPQQPRGFVQRAVRRAEKRLSRGK